jgi:hypothetical protein
LDDNWKYNDSIGNPGYWLSVNSFRDSQISVEKIPIDFYEKHNLTDNEFCRLNILGSGDSIDYSSIYDQIKENSFYVAFTIYDENKVKNYQCIIIKNINGQKYVINFSTFSDIFDANISYYKKILDRMEE